VDIDLVALKKPLGAMGLLYYLTLLSYRPCFYFDTIFNVVIYLYIPMNKYIAVLSAAKREIIANINYLEQYSNFH